MLGLGAQAQGAAPAARRVAARAPLPGELARRIEAQLVDVAWALVPRRDPATPGLDADLALAAAAEADAVITVRRTGAGFALWLTDARRGRHYRRDIEGLEPGTPGSVTEEATAVAIRGSLESLRRTGDAGWILEAERPPLALEVGGGAGLTADGLAAHPELRLSIGVFWRSWGGVLSGWVGVPRSAGLDAADVNLARHGLRLEARRRIALTGRLELELGLGGGLALTRRSTEAAPGVTPSSPRTLATGLVGARLQLNLRLGATRGWLGVGADAALGRPALDVQTPRGVARAAEAAPVSAWAVLGVSAEIFDVR